MRNELAGCAGGRMGFNARRFSEVKSLDVGVVESNSGNALSIGIFTTASLGQFTRGWTPTTALVVAVK